MRLDHLVAHPVLVDVDLVAIGVLSHIASRSSCRCGSTLEQYPIICSAQWYVPRMATMTVSKHVAARADTVWTILADFANVSWIPVAGRVEIAGDGVGMSRSIYGGGDTPVVETLTSIEPERMELGYRITNNPLPVSRFDASVSVTPAEPEGSSIVTWNVDYEPAGDTAADATAARECRGRLRPDGWLAGRRRHRGARSGS